MKGQIPWNKGKKGVQRHSEATRKKMSESAKKHKNIGDWARGRRGEETNRWKGDNISYQRMHIWIRETLGNPKECEHCGTTEAKIFDWANKSRTYKRDLSDWLRLCRRCHITYDHGDRTN